MDLPLFGDHPTKRRREINLGGVNGTRAHGSILQNAHERRAQREEEVKEKLLDKLYDTKLLYEGGEVIIFLPTTLRIGEGRRQQREKRGGEGG